MGLYPAKNDLTGERGGSHLSVFSRHPSPHVQRHHSIDLALFIKIKHQGSTSGSGSGVETAFIPTTKMRIKSDCIVLHATDCGHLFLKFDCFFPSPPNFQLAHMARSHGLHAAVLFSTFLRPTSVLHYYREGAVWQPRSTPRLDTKIHTRTSTT